MKMTTEEALEKIDNKFLKVFSEELLKVFGEDIFSMPGDDESEYMMGPPVFYLEGTVGWTDAFKRACKKTGMTKLSDWYCDLDWIVSDEFDGELGEWLIWFNDKYPDDIAKLRDKIFNIKDKLENKKK